MDILSTFITFTLLAAVQCQLSVNITTTAPSSPFDGGLDSIEIHCKAVVNDFDFLSIRKQSPIVDGTDSDYPVVTNQVVEADYRDGAKYTGRYSVTYDYDGDTKVGDLRLTVTGFDIYDAGRYLCRLSASGSGELAHSESKNITVNVPVDDVKIARILSNGTLEDVQDNAVIQMISETNGGIACLVSLKSYVNVPQVNVMVNGMPSSYFTFGDVMLIDSATGSYQFVYKYTTSQPAYVFHGNVVKCMASTLNTQEQSATVLATATFKPVIECENLTVDVPVDENAEVTCAVYSNPAADLTVNYGLTYTDNSLEVDANRNGKFEFITHSGDLSNRTVTFKIYQITEGLISSYKYRIRAQSTLGMAEKMFSFREKFISSSSIPVSSVTIVAFSLALVLLGCSS